MFSPVVKCRNCDHEDMVHNFKTDTAPAGFLEAEETWVVCPECDGNNTAFITDEGDIAIVRGRIVHLDV